jgi:methyltransferase (TIGR00027 family)
MTTATPDLDTLARTAWWTAAARACESARADKLFDDPFAAMLAGAASVAAFGRADLRPGAAPRRLEAITTRCFDDFLLHAAARDDIAQVVLLASGLDTRAFRLPWPAGVSLFEIDQPHLIAYKKLRLTLARVRPACTWHPIGADLRGAWMRRLRAAGFEGSKPSVWLLEACLQFFEPRDVATLLGQISAAAAAGSRMAFDVVNERFLSQGVTRHWNDDMSRGGAPWLFTCDDPAGLVAPLGWQARVTDAAAAGAHLRPASFPAGGSTVEAPRTLLTTATREA